MKKALSVLWAVLFIFAVGCNTKILPNQNNTHHSQINQHTNENQGQQIKSNNDKNDISNTLPNTQTPSYSDGNVFIGEQKAKQIALEKAGLTESEVLFEKIELDIDDIIPQYEIEFKKGSTEYSADINAKDGKIIDWDIDFFD